MSVKRYVLEGEWYPYGTFPRVVHREIVQEWTAAAACAAKKIRLADDTLLVLTARARKSRERVIEIQQGYGPIINDCLALGVSSVSEIEPAREAKRAARIAAEAAQA